MVMRFFFNCHIAACGGGYTWWQILARVTKSLILSQKIQLIEFLMIFWGGANFFGCRIACARVATHVIFTVQCMVTQQFSKKLHHHHKQKTACVATALRNTCEVDV